MDKRNLLALHLIKLQLITVSKENNWGNLLDSSHSGTHIIEAVQMLYFRFNSLLFKFKYASMDVKYCLFKSYCAAFMLRGENAVDF